MVLYNVFVPFVGFNNNTVKPVTGRSCVGWEGFACGCDVHPVHRA